MNGIKDAQIELKDSHARICPTLNMPSDNAWSKGMLGWSTKNQAVTVIEYDVAVEVTTEGKGGGKISVATGLINAAGGGERKTGDKVASRIQFSVPVAYPDIAD